jgi:hypothetical protein
MNKIRSVIVRHQKQLWIKLMIIVRVIFSEKWLKLKKMFKMFRIKKKDS